MGENIYKKTRMRDLCHQHDVISYSSVYWVCITT